MSENEQHEKQTPDEYKVKYIKSNLHRIIYVDAIWASPTPNLDICLSLGSERFPIPDQVVYSFNPDGSLGDEITEKREQADGVNVELEITAILTIENTKSLINLLQNLIDKIEEDDEE